MRFYVSILQNNSTTESLDASSFVWHSLLCGARLQLRV